MGRIIAIVNQKGGVGKTTTSVNLAAAMAANEKRVLLVDFDPQGNATTLFGIDKQTKIPTVYDFLAGKAPLEKCLRVVSPPFLKLIPANSNLAGGEVELVNITGREFVLRDVLNNVHDQFDLVILDCPPSLGMLTLNCLVAANSVLIPMQCEFLAMEGLTQLLKTVDLVRKKLHPGLEVEGVLLTMYTAGVGHNDQVAVEVRRHMGEMVFKTVIPRNSAVSESPSFGKPVVWYDPWSDASRAYFELAIELLGNRA